MRSEGKFCALFFCPAFGFASLRNILDFFFGSQKKRPSMLENNPWTEGWDAEKKTFSGRSRAMAEPDLAFESEECEGREQSSGGAGSFRLMRSTRRSFCQTNFSSLSLSIRSEGKGSGREVNCAPNRTMPRTNCFARPIREHLFLPFVSLFYR
jgi:hypothetical protein